MTVYSFYYTKHFSAVVHTGRRCEAMMTERNDSPNHSPGAAITLILEPTGGTKTVPRPKTVYQLLDRLAIRHGSALIIRDGELLTPDRSIKAGDTITVRSVVSRG